MAKYRTKAGVAPALEVEAAQWWKNGDHPADFAADTQGIEKGELRTFSGEFRKAQGWEGSVVRYFRHPGVPAAKICGACSQHMHDHGWIDSGGSGQLVCPGSYVVTVSTGYDVVEAAKFEAEFEALPA